MKWTKGKPRNNYNGTAHTFVICAYQESRYLEQCIRSLQEQSVKSNICISTSTLNAYIISLADKYDLQIFVNKGEKGLAADWNYAVSCSWTPLVTLAHQDDVYCKDYTKNILDALNRCNHPLIAFTDYYELRQGMIVKRNWLLLIKRLMLLPLRIKVLWNSKFLRRCILSFGSAICCPSVTIVKENLQLPIFKNNMRSNIDWQAWAEISTQAGEFAYVSKPSVIHRIHRDSTTSELLQENGRKEEDLIVFRMFWPEWMARLLEKFYQGSEKSNRVEKK